jgi:FixJ family two-component response regulator
VEGHRARIMLKLELASLSDLIRYAVRKKIVEV